MDFKSHLKLIARHIPSIAIALAIALFLAFTTGGSLLTTGYNATIFTTFSVKKDFFPTQISTSYDDVRAADHFTETVRGWFKNPSFMDKINKSFSKTDKSTADSHLSIRAERQEKQNLIINYFVSQEKSVKPASSAITTNLISAIDRYNQTSTATFQLASHDTHYSKSASRFNFLLIFALLAGLCAGIAISYLIEYFAGKTMNASQASNILEKQPDELIYAQPFKKKSPDYLKALLSESGTKKQTIVFTWSKTSSLQKDLTVDFSPKSTDFIEFTQNPSKMSKHQNHPLIVFVKLGKTRLDDLFRIKALLPEKYFLVILE